MGGAGAVGGGLNGAAFRQCAYIHTYVGAYGRGRAHPPPPPPTTRVTCVCHTMTLYRTFLRSATHSAHTVGSSDPVSPSLPRSTKTTPPPPPRRVVQAEHRRHCQGGAPWWGWGWSWWWRGSCRSRGLYGRSSSPATEIPLARPRTRPMTIPVHSGAIRGGGRAPVRRADAVPPPSSRAHHAGDWPAPLVPPPPPLVFPPLSPPPAAKKQQQNKRRWATVGSHAPMHRGEGEWWGWVGEGWVVAVGEREKKKKRGGNASRWAARRPQRPRGGRGGRCPLATHRPPPAVTATATVAVVVTATRDRHRDRHRPPSPPPRRGRRA